MEASQQEEFAELLAEVVRLDERLAYAQNRLLDTGWEAPKVTYGEGWEATSVGGNTVTARRIGALVMVHLVAKRTGSVITATSTGHLPDSVMLTIEDPRFRPERNVNSVVGCHYTAGDCYVGTDGRWVLRSLMPTASLGPGANGGQWVRGTLVYCGGPWVLKSLRVPASWNTKSRQTMAAAASWQISQTYGTSARASWKTRQRQTLAAGASWPARERSAVAAGIAWRLRARPAVAGSSAWALRQRGAISRAASWMVGAGGRGSAALAWRARARVSSAWPSSWASLLTDRRAADLAWRLNVRAHLAADLAWRSRSRRDRTGELSWRADARPRLLIGMGWAVDEPDVQRERKVRMRWHVRRRTSTAASSSWGVTDTYWKTADTAWRIRRRLQVIAGIGWRIAAEPAHLVMGWSVAQRNRLTVGVAWTANIRPRRPVALAWRVHTGDAVQASSAWRLDHRDVRACGSGWQLAHRAHVAVGMAWVFTGRLVEVAWHVDQRLTLAVAVRWATHVRAGNLTQTLGWRVADRQHLAVGSSWQSAGFDAVGQSMRWNTAYREHRCWIYAWNTEEFQLNPDMVLLTWQRHVVMEDDLPLITWRRHQELDPAQRESPDYINTGLP
ncbi:hypothetical protein [Actinomadura atramentaria]|uniref:hypothetical protein n=1 Tax=Actinomadura atramentaria TaxID=1990 RepID=UPI00036CE111|nr:hypothetical protein [Actinomadura atramentaria]